MEYDSLDCKTRKQELREWLTAMRDSNPQVKEYSLLLTLLDKTDLLIETYAANDEDGGTMRPLLDYLQGFLA